MKIEMKKKFFEPTAIREDDQIPDVSNSPVLIAKKNRAIEFLKKHPIPDDIRRRSLDR
ncbi:hypothetical protein [Dyadobacter bucti]|uniref:hypothetical protein n=1 Tax=Dyadobacter bucti TaxID=2572203 RepID=UPI003F70E0FF